MKQPVWVRGRVPNGYWSTRSNRVKYMDWLGRRLRFRKTEDWYRLTRRCFLDHFGGGLLATVYNHSPLRALQDYKPRYDWKPWLLTSTPQGYWRNPANRRKYLVWLGKELGLRRASDWYELTQADFRAHGGNGLLALYYRNSPIDAIREFKPHRQWDEWRFPATSQGFWRRRANRRLYMAWLGEQLGYREPEDWYAVRRRDFYENGGGALLHTIPGRSPLAALREYMPDYDWLEWRFARVPNGFWRRRKNRYRFLDTLGRELGYKRLSDWYNLTREAVREAGGSALLSSRYNNSLMNLLRDRFPNHKWNADRLYRRDDRTQSKLPLRQRRLAA